MRSVTIMLAVAAVVGGLVIAYPQSAVGQSAASQAAAPPLAAVDLNRLTSESAEGRNSTARIQELREQKLAELEAGNIQAQGEVTALNQQLGEAQQKLELGQNLITAAAAVGLQNDIARLQREIQRKSQDAQASLARLQEDGELEVQVLARDLQVEFEEKLGPAVNQLMAEKGIGILVRMEAVVLADPALDLTDELIELFDNQAAAAP